MDRISSERRSANMSRIRGKNTRPEIMVRRLLHALGYRFRLHVGHLPGKPDIVLARHRVAIFVNGCFWHVHDCPKGAVKPKTNAEFWEKKRQGNVQRDAAKQEALVQLGWRVLIVWECETANVQHLQKRLEQFINESRSPSRDDGAGIPL